MMPIRLVRWIAPDEPHPCLPFALRASAIGNLVYFTLGHWLLPAWFFNQLGVAADELSSSFLLNQLRLIGVLVLGYSGLLWLVASDIVRYRTVLAIVMLVGMGCVIVFVVDVARGTVPALFLANAAILMAQLTTVSALSVCSQSSGRPGGPMYD